MEMKLSLIQKIILKLNGRVCVDHRQLPGWSVPLPFYAFHCPEHGLVVNRSHGFYDYINCPKCLEERDLKIESMVKS